MKLPVCKRPVTKLFQIRTSFVRPPRLDKAPNLLSPHIDASVRPTLSRKKLYLSLAFLRQETSNHAFCSWLLSVHDGFIQASFDPNRKSIWASSTPTGISLDRSLGHQDRLSTAGPCDDRSSRRTGSLRWDVFESNSKVSNG